jgi:hypothetical protein
MAGQGLGRAGLGQVGLRLAVRTKFCIFCFFVPFAFFFLSFVRTKPAYLFCFWIGKPGKVQDSLVD